MKVRANLRAQLLAACAVLSSGAGCGSDERARLSGDPPDSIGDPNPPAREDASSPDPDLDAGLAPAPLPDPDAGPPDPPRYWDGSTTPTADNVKGVDASAGEQARGFADAGEP